MLPLLRLANPLVRGVLASPGRRVLDRALLVLDYRGRRTGRRFRIPVMYARDGDRVLVLAARPEAKQWWRTFRGGAPATLTIAGRTLRADGELLAGAEKHDALRTYLARFPRSGHALGAAADGRPEELHRAATRVAIVAFAPRARDRRADVEAA